MAYLICSSESFGFNFTSPELHEVVLSCRQAYSNKWTCLKHKLHWSVVMFFIFQLAFPAVLSPQAYFLGQTLLKILFVSTGKWSEFRIFWEYVLPLSAPLIGTKIKSVFKISMSQKQRKEYSNRDWYYLAQFENISYITDGKAYSSVDMMQWVLKINNSTFSKHKTVE